MVVIITVSFAVTPNRHMYYLDNWNGLSGKICLRCFDLLKKDSDGNFVDPQQYLIMLLKQKDPG